MIALIGVIVPLLLKLVFHSRKNGSAPPEPEFQSELINEYEEVIQITKEYPQNMR